MSSTCRATNATARFTPQVGWYVGYVERGEQVTFFALNLDIESQEDVDARKAIARLLLAEMGALGPGS